MRHATDTVLSRLLDEPATVADSDRRHVAGCRPCLGALAALRAGPTADVDRAPGTASASPARPAGRRLRSVLGRPVAAGLAVAAVVTGAGTAAANDWLPAFRTEQVAPVSLTADDLVALPDLSAYGDLAVTGEEGLRPVPDAATAAAETGLDVPQVGELPRGVAGEPRYQVGEEVSATFTFSTERAAGAAAASGETLPPVPSGLDGSSVRLVAGPGVAGIWTSSAGAPALVVGRAVAPTASTSGVPFEVARDYLLSLPGLPEEVAGQLRSFAADGSTLPLPVPADEVTTSSAEVDGSPATVLVARDRTMAAVVWVDGGVVTAVAGSLDAGEVLAVARDLR